MTQRKRQRGSAVHGWFVGGIVVQAIMEDHFVGLEVGIVFTAVEADTPKAVEYTFVNGTIHQAAGAVSVLH